MAKKTNEPTNDPKSIFGIEPTEAAALMAKLTPRQREVAERMAMGEPNRTIAAELGISVKTLDIHRNMIGTKFDSPSIGIARIVFASKFAAASEEG